MKDSVQQGVFTLLREPLPPQDEDAQRHWWWDQGWFKAVSHIFD